MRALASAHTVACTLACSLTCLVACVATGCAPGGSEGEGEADTLSGVWRWQWTDRQRDAEQVLIVDDGDTVHVTRCGSQNGDPEAWAREDDRLTVSDHSAPAGTVDGTDALASEDSADDWRACKQFDADHFGAGSFSLDGDEGGLFSAASGVCAMRDTTNHVRIAALTEGQMARFEIDNVPADASGDVFTTGNIIVEATGVNAFVDVTLVLHDSTTTKLAAEIGAVEQLDGGARQYAGSIDVDLPGACE